MKQKDKICREIQDMICTSRITHINKEDMKKLQDHIKTCETCMEYQEVINNIIALMQVEGCEKFNLDDSIRKSLIRQVKKNSGDSWLRKTGSAIDRFFQYKIPVYQSVLAFIIIFFTIYEINSIQSQKEQETDINISIDSLETYPVPVEYQYVIENMDIIGAQKKGESIMEDSSIVTYSYPIL